MLADMLANAFLDCIVFVSMFFGFVVGVLRKLKAWFGEKQILKWLAFNAVVNFVLIMIWIQVEAFFKADLQLKPSIPEDTSGFLPVAILILPLSLLFEDLGLRVMPDQMLRLLKVKERLKPGVYLVFFVVVSAVWHSLLHQMNIIAADNIARIGYALIQGYAGCFLAWLYIKKGFWASYTVHLSWDLILISIMVIQQIL